VTRPLHRARALITDDAEILPRHRCRSCTRKGSQQFAPRDGCSWSGQQLFHRVTRHHTTTTALLRHDLSQCGCAGHSPKRRRRLPPKRWRLVEVMRDKTASPSARIRAAELVLDRAHGKAAPMAEQPRDPVVCATVDAAEGEVNH
jgi:hypothetical protein